MKIKIVKGKKYFTYTASCYCKYCGLRMRDVTLETNYELEDEEPFITVYSKRICRLCSGKDENE